MSSKSIEQLNLMQAALGIKEGKIMPAENPRANKIAKQMTIEQLQDFASGLEE